jgi:hypothetical protein
MKRANKTLRTRRRTRQRGRAYVGQGAHGCGFRPALLCDTNAARRPYTFSKLMYAADAAEELATREILAPIDPTQRMYVYPAAVCGLTPSANDELEKCRLAAGPIVPPYDNLRVVQMPDGGYTPVEHIHFPAGSIVNYMRSWSDLFAGLHNLHKEKYYHCDIKPNNIVTTMLETGAFLTRYIDFGFLIHGDQVAERAEPDDSVFTDYNIFNMSYNIYCFDTKFLDPNNLKFELYANPRRSDEEVNAAAAAFMEYAPHLPPLLDVPEAARTDDQNAMIGSLTQILNSLDAVKRNNITSIPFFYEKVVEVDKQYYPFGVYYNEDMTPRLTQESVVGKLSSYSIIPNVRNNAILHRNDLYGLARTLSWMYVILVQHTDYGIREPLIATFGGVYKASAVAWVEEVRRDVSVPFFRLIRKMLDPINPEVRVTALQHEYLQIMPAVERLFSGNQFADALEKHPHYIIARS